MNILRNATVCAPSALVIFDTNSKFAGKVRNVQNNPNTIADMAAPIIICDKRIGKLNGVMP
jgi:hypothetical protein